MLVMDILGERESILGVGSATPEVGINTVGLKRTQEL
jgi:hypothetical protein